jgi:hypothetical protein
MGDIKDVRFWAEIHVDEHGKMEEIGFKKDLISGKTDSSIVFFTYLKSMQIGHKKDYDSYYVLTLDCKNLEYCLGGLNVNRTDKYFMITTAANRDRLFNAFAHLLELAYLNKNFYSKDPFENK